MVTSIAHTTKGEQAQRSLKKLFETKKMEYPLHFKRLLKENRRNSPLCINSVYPRMQEIMEKRGA